MTPLVCRECGCPHAEVLLQTLRCANPFCRFFHSRRADMLQSDTWLVRDQVFSFVYSVARLEAGKGDDS